MSRADEQGDSTTRTVLLILGVFAGLFILLALVCGGGLYLLFTRQIIPQLNQIVQGGPPSPGLDLQDADYAKERTQFKTNLLRKGPSPQAWKPELLPAGVMEVDYSSGNLTLRAWITPPADPGKPKRSAVLFLHAGHSFDHTDWEMPQPYRDAGFVVMVPMRRGENGLPGSFSLFYDEVEDTLAAADYLAKRPDIDAEKIYLAGDEVGGSLALLAAMSSKRFRAAASISAPSDPVAHARRSFPAAACFDLQNVREFRMRSPVAYATSFKCPVRLYAANGSMMDQSDQEAQEVAKRAKTKGLDVEVVILPGNQTSIIPAAIQASIDFFRKK
jgi:dienelactone hydrolase